MKMASQLIESHREGAEIYHRDEALCKRKVHEMLREFSLPRGLFPAEILEFGHHRATGFIWLKHKNKVEHKFKLINKVISLDIEVAAFVEKNRLRNLIGIKGKETFFWFTVSHIFIEDPSSAKITFQVSNGLSGAFPVLAFELEEDKGGR